MQLIKKTQENINKLAQEAVDQLDLNDLLQWAYERHQSYYESMTEEEFTEAWNETFDYLED